MSKTRYVLVNSEILPEVYRKVLLAKSYIAGGDAANVSEAIKKANLSRSAYYKYKDAIYEYNQADNSEVVTLSAALLDNPGVLSNVMSALYHMGANILSINQNIPVNNVATVSMSVRIVDLKVSIDDLIDKVKLLNGVKSIELIK